MIQNALKFEVYGLIIIAICLIALTRFGWIGELFFGVFRFFAGNWDFLFPITGIVIALYMMVKRTWPTLRTSKWTGYWLLVFSLLIFQHLQFSDLEGMSILKETWNAFVDDRAQLAQGEVPTTRVGGGMTGAVGLLVFSYLFGVTGTRIVIFFMTLIGIILLFRVSFVTLMQRINKKIVGIFKKGNDKVMHSLTSLSEKKQKNNEFSGDSYEKEEMPNDLSEGHLDAHHEDLLTSPFVDHDGETPVIHDFADHLQKQQTSTAEGEPDQNQSDERARGSRSATISVQLNQDDEKVKDGFQQELKEDGPISEYKLPSIHMLDKGPNGVHPNVAHKDMQQNARKLERTLESFGVKAKVTQIHRGPAVTRYEVQPAVGVKVSRIVNLTDDIALALAAKDIRMEAPIPGKPAIGIEVPNKEVAMVSLREVLESPAFQRAESKLSVALGRDISGEAIVANLGKMPHLLVAGATGSGKSVCINSIVTSLLFKAKPQEVKLMMIDPKMVELNVYNGIPHLLAPVVTDPRRAAVALKKVLAEMERRYELFAKSGTRDIDRYNQMMAQKTGKKEEEQSPALPYIVVIVDELADLMMVAPADVEDAICRLAQMARAAGIHLIIATQRPSVDVITGVIKANIPSRIAFGVSSQADSRTILDMGGAEKLLGRGDMLYYPVGANKPIRVQGTFVSDSEVEAIVNYVKNQQEARYQEEMIPEEHEEHLDETDFEDELFDKAVQVVVDAQTASVSMLQRRFRIGYTRAARLIDAMEARGIVGPYEGSKPREVLVPRGSNQGGNTQHNPSQISG